MPPLDRREFLKQSGKATAGVTLGLSVLANGRAKAGPNDVVRVGVVGVRGRGNSHIQGFENLPDAEVVAVCDVDEEVLSNRAGALDSATGRKVKRFVDMRALFDDPDVDAVSIATPNHWHSLGGIWAMQAGKDTYVEKPCSHNIWEGRQLVNAARQTGRMCQHGTQGRSAPSIREAVAKLREGVIGEVYLAKALCYKWRNTIGKVVGPQQPPEGVDYNLWIGPAAMKPLQRQNLHYDWHWQWDYGNGDIGNQGVHEMDMARWGLGVGLPTRVTAMGGHFMFDDDQQTPNVLHAAFEYPERKKMLEFEVRHWITNHEGGFGSGESNTVGVIFYGSEGYMTVEYFGYETFLGRKREPGPSGQGAGSEWATFIAGVRSRKQEDLGVDIEEGHLSSALCHLANMSYRLGRAIDFDPASEQPIGDDDAIALMSRDYRSPFVVPAVG
jgi:predicted dehydrogenase